MKRFFGFILQMVILIMVFVYLTPVHAQEFVRVMNQDLYLGDKKFFIKGASHLGVRYIGEYPAKATIENVDYENYNIMVKFHDFRPDEIEKDLVFLKKNLGINTIRYFTPSINAFANLVTYQGFAPWYLEDGSINPIYLDRIKTFLSICRKHNLKVHFELFHNLKSSVNFDTHTFIPPGSADETFYLTYLQSLIPQLKDDPTVIAYEISNEMLVESSVNYWDHSWYEPQMLSFIKRMADKIRSLDQNHLIASNEVVSSQEGDHANTWHAPTADFGLIEDIDNLNGGQPFRLYDVVDYISPHLYEYKDGQNMISVGIDKIMNLSEKPVVWGEFGYRWPNNLLTDKSEYADEQKSYYERLAQKTSVVGGSGLIAWNPYPFFKLIPDAYTKSPDPLQTSGYAYNLIRISSPEPRNIRLYQDTWEIFDHNDDPLPAAIYYRNFYNIELLKQDADIDNSGVLNYADLKLMIRNYSLRIDFQPDYDLYDDEVINTVDTTKVIRAINI